MNFSPLIFQDERIFLITKIHLTYVLLTPAYVPILQFNKYPYKQSTYKIISVRNYQLNPQAVQPVRLWHPSFCKDEENPKRTDVKDAFGRKGEKRFCHRCWQFTLLIVRRESSLLLVSFQPYLFPAHHNLRSFVARLLFFNLTPIQDTSCDVSPKQSWDASKPMLGNRSKSFFRSQEPKSVVSLSTPCH